jgi:Zn-finger nucleic acid-binding protein
MSLSTPICPSCRAALTLTHEGTFNSWACPAGHGVAATLTQGYERLQEDELHHVWQLARAATPTTEARSCPVCEHPMVNVEVPYDPDEIEEGQPGDGADTGAAWLDVCVDCEVIWFDAGELMAFPADLPDAEPTPAELDAVAKIRDTFGQGVEAAEHAREDAQLTEHLYRRIARHPRLNHFLTGVGSLGRSS